MSCFAFYLNEPGPQVLVNEEVVSEYLKLVRIVLVDDEVLRRQVTVYDQIVKALSYVSFDLRGIAFKSQVQSTGYSPVLSLTLAKQGALLLRTGLLLRVFLLIFALLLLL